RLREAPLVALRELRAAAGPVEAVRGALRFAVRAAYGLDGAPAGEGSRLDLRCVAAAERLLDELEAWSDLGEALSEEDVLAALERLEVPPGDASAGRVAVLDLMR